MFAAWKKRINSILEGIYFLHFIYIDKITLISLEDEFLSLIQGMGCGLQLIGKKQFYWTSCKLVLMYRVEIIKNFWT